MVPSTQREVAKMKSLRNLPPHGWLMLGLIALTAILGMMAIFRYAEGEPLADSHRQPSLRQRCLEASDYNYDACRNLD